MPGRRVVPLGVLSICRCVTPPDRRHAMARRGCGPSGALPLSRYRRRGPRKAASRRPAARRSGRAARSLARKIGPCMCVANRRIYLRAIAKCPRSSSHILRESDRYVVPTSARRRNVRPAAFEILVIVRDIGGDHDPAAQAIFETAAADANGGGHFALCGVSRDCRDMRYAVQ